MSLSCCLILTLVTWKSKTLMLHLFLSFKMSPPYCLMPAQVRWICNTFLYGFFLIPQIFPLRCLVTSLYNNFVCWFYVTPQSSGLFWMILTLSTWIFTTMLHLFCESEDVHVVLSDTHNGYINVTCVDSLWLTLWAHEYLPPMLHLFLLIGSKNGCLYQCFRSNKTLH